MEERGNQTVMCSVFFLDIVEYSRKSVTGQISLKDRFNDYLSTAIRDVPVTDRIILDTGDGAAINFLGDIEDALKAALNLREKLIDEDPDEVNPLLVRMGINLGPVRLVRDINGQPNIVGDGINVAQRVMSFADPGQILVSRSYYDAVSRLSPQYTGMFHYQGSRTDKHVREHEVYAIGYPGDKTTQRGSNNPFSKANARNLLARTTEQARTLWRSAATRLDALMGRMVTGFLHADPQQRAIYVGVIAIPLLLLVVLTAKLLHRDEVQNIPDSIDKTTASASQPVSTDVPVPTVQANAKHKAQAGKKPEVKSASKKKAIDSKVARQKAKLPVVQPKTPAHVEAKDKPAATPSAGNSNGFISVSCREGTEVFVDGVRKAMIKSSPLNISITPGKHMVIVSHPRAGVYSQDVVIESGRTVHLNPGICK